MNDLQPITQARWPVHSASDEPLREAIGPYLETTRWVPSNQLTAAGRPVAYLAEVVCTLCRDRGVSVPCATFCNSNFEMDRSTADYFVAHFHVAHEEKIEGSADKP